MHAHPVLRNTSFIARGLLAWFVLSLMVAVAAPLLRQTNTVQVCSAAGVMSSVYLGDPTGMPVMHASLECPLCAMLGAPPPAPSVLPATVQAVWPYAAPAWLVAAQFERSCAPLPARGPPTDG